MGKRNASSFLSLFSSSLWFGYFVILVLFRSRSQSSIFIFTKSKSSKRTCLANVQGADLQIFARARAHVSNPLSTCWHAGIRPFFFSTLSLCVFYFFFIGYIVSISKESAAFLHNRLGGSGLEKPRRTTNFVITQNKGKPDWWIRIDSRQHETFIRPGDY